MPETRERDKVTMYRTSDLYFASYLCALDIQMDGAIEEPSGNSMGNKKIFVFRMPSKDVNRLKASYFNGTGTVKALRFVQHLKSLKSMCHC